VSVGNNKQGRDKMMDEVFVTDVEVGNKVINSLSGSTFIVGKIEKRDDGRIALYNEDGELMNVSGKKVKYMICF
jgi:hypothetical protein